MNKSNTVWIKTEQDKLKSLIADEAKNANILANLANTIKQLQAKNAFRLALLNQLLENIDDHK